MTLTGWLTKIFKGSSHKVQKGYFNAKHGSDTDGNHASTSSSDAWSAIEDIDRAIALSLSEEDRNGKNVIDSNTQLKEDEQLARALQESLNLNVESPPHHGNQNRNGNGNKNGNGNEFDNRISNGNTMGNGYGIGNGNIYQQPPPHPYSMGFSGKVCAGCHADIAQGTYLTCMGVIWHPECFRCHACNHPISDYEFSMNQNFRYHKLCYKEQYHPKCDICKQFIPTNPQGLIEYRAHPFWHQKYCPFHEHDRTPRCCSCERMEAIDSRFVVLEDGRKLCLECLDSSIMDTNVCQPLYLDIKEFYEGLNMKVEQQVPLLLVERQALNEAMDAEKTGHHHLPETRGLCLSEEQTVSTVSRRPKVGSGNRAMAMRTEPYKLTRRCEVTAILILYGLPRLLTGSILAHEMMHAWLRLKGFRTLSQEVEEGICQVLAHMWLESQIIPVSNGYVASSSTSSSSSFSTSSSSSFSTSSSSSKHEMRSPLERKLGEFFKHQIEYDTSIVYGNGFRAGNAAVQKYGLQSTLEHIRYTGTFPY